MVIPILLELKFIKRINLLQIWPIMISGNNIFLLLFLYFFCLFIYNILGLFNKNIVGFKMGEFAPKLNFQGHAKKRNRSWRQEKKLRKVRENNTKILYHSSTEWKEQNRNKISPNFVILLLVRWKDSQRFS